MSLKTKILIVTDSPVLPTGMAETTRLIFNTLLDQYPDQYELHQIGLFHCNPVTTARWPVYPTRTIKLKDGRMAFTPDDAYGQKTFPEVVAKVQPDIVFAFNDPHRVAHLCASPAQRPYKLILYLNVDGLPISPEGGNLLNQADRIITMSEFSKDVLTGCMPAIDTGKVQYLYSPADTVRFYPVSEAEKLELRQKLFPPWMPRNAFILGWVGRNQWRKQVWLPYKVISYLRKGGYGICQDCHRVSLPNEVQLLNERLGLANEKPALPNAGISCRHCRSSKVEQAAPLSDVYLWLHMNDEPNIAWPKAYLEQLYEVKAGLDIHYTEGHAALPHHAPADMAALYHSWDVLLYLSGGEGFGLPALEALCSCLPVIYTNYSSHAELIIKARAGLPVGGILQPEGKSCLWRMIADVPQVLEAVHALYGDRELCHRIGSRGHDFVQPYRSEAQAAQWREIIHQCLK